MNLKYKIKTKSLFLFFLILGVFIYANPLQAFGQLTQPIIIDNAMRNQLITEEVLLLNNKDKSVVVELKSEGDIKDWIKYYVDEKSSVSINQIIVATSSNLKIVAKITVPSDIPNGDYSGLIAVVLKMNENQNSTTTYANIAQVVEREVSVRVTDIEELELDVVIIPNSYDLFPGDDLELKMDYFNEGNIEVKPDVRIKIIKDDKVFYDRIYPYLEENEGIKPLNSKEIILKGISFEGLDFQKYIVSVFVLNDNEQIFQKSININYSKQKAVVSSTKSDQTYNAGSTKIIIFTAISIFAGLIIILLYYDKKHQVKKI